MLVGAVINELERVPCLVEASAEQTPVDWGTHGPEAHTLHAQPWLAGAEGDFCLQVRHEPDASLPSLVCSMTLWKEVFGLE